MAPDTGPDESANQNDEYLSNAPAYNFPDGSSDEDEDIEEEVDYIGNDDDSDVGDNMAGYQLLNQEGGEDNSGEDRGEGVDNMRSYPENEINSYNINPSNIISSMIDLPPPPVDEISNQLEPTSRPDIELDEVKIDQIKQAMSGFRLPSSSIPGWASVVTEDQLANYIHCKTKSNELN